MCVSGGHTNISEKENKTVATRGREWDWGKKEMAVRGCDGTDRWMNKARDLMHKARISTSKTAAE